MKMKREHAQILCDMIILPHLSPRSRLIVIRRLTRHVQAERALVREYFADEMKKFTATLPFTQRQLSVVEAARAEATKEYKQQMWDFGEWLYENDALLTATYGFDGICDILEVNPVHRDDVVEYAEDMGRSISAAAFISGYEDSASRYSGRHPSDYKDGPLFHVFLEMMMKVVKERSEVIPNPFAPGGPFYGIPTYYQKPDGTMARKSASLTVHDPDGSSRVVERKIEVKP